MMGKMALKRFLVFFLVLAVAFCWSGRRSGVLAKTNAAYRQLYAQRAEEMIRNFDRSITLGDRRSGAVILARMARMANGWGDSTDTKTRVEADITSLLNSSMDDEHHAFVSIIYGLRKYPDLVSSSLKQRVFNRGMSYVWPVSGTGEVRWSNHMTTWISCGLLSAEGLGNATKVKYYKDVFIELFERSIRGGEIEFNSPSYDSLNFIGLMPLLISDDQKVQMRARFLLDLKAAYSAHLLLPGYVYVGPESRDYGGPIEDNNWGDETIYLLFPEPMAPGSSKTSYTVSQAVMAYQPPDQLREIYLKKAGAQSFEWRRNVELLNTTNEGTGLTVEGVLTNPMHFYVLKDQAGAMGAAHAYSAGWPSNGHTNNIRTSGVSGKETILTQIQPGTTTDYVYGGEVGSGLDDWDKEYGGRARRMFFRNVMVQIWNPYGKTYEFTQARIPKYEQLERSGDWWFGRQDEVYIAYRVFGESLAVAEKTDFWRVKAGGISGGVAEIAHADEVGSFADFKSDILAREFSFSVAEKKVSYQAKDKAGNKVAVSVTYTSSPLSGRTINEQTVMTADLDIGLLESPWISFDRENSFFYLAYDGYPTLKYDWENLTVSEMAPTVTPTAGMTVLEILRRWLMVSPSLNEDEKVNGLDWAKFVSG